MWIQYLSSNLVPRVGFYAASNYSIDYQVCEVCIGKECALLYAHTSLCQQVGAVCT